MKTLYITKGYLIDTPTGHQEVVSQYGETCYIVHNYDADGNYTGVSYITDREILHAEHDRSGKVYTGVEYDRPLWYAVMRDRDDDWGTGSYVLDKATEMLRQLREIHPDALIAVIDNSTENPICVDEITDI